jgi:hypothetical protein
MINLIKVSIFSLILASTYSMANFKINFKLSESISSNIKIGVPVAPIECTNNSMLANSYVVIGGTVNSNNVIFSYDSDAFYIKEDGIVPENVEYLGFSYTIGERFGNRTDYIYHDICRVPLYE